MKKNSSAFLFVLLLLSAGSVKSQSLDAGKTLYQNGDYERAIRAFEQIDTLEAYLFLGKSYFSLGRYHKAKTYLEQTIADAVDDGIASEAAYTKALVLFQLNDLAAALDLLHEMRIENKSSVFYQRSIMFYDQIISFLSINQIKTVFNQSKYKEVLADVIAGAFGRVSFSQANVLLTTLKSSLADTASIDLFQLEAALADSANYRARFPLNKHAFAPNGMAYQIGVALPSFEIESENYEIPQHLYFGIQMAVEEFNVDNFSKKAFINFSQTNSLYKKPEDVLNELVWKNDVDVVIGPLFSDVTKSFSKLAEEYEVPIIPPLANSDELNISSNYVFQTNPTFEVQGIKMAQYAVNTLGLDTLAVLAEMNSLGEASALAFRREAEQLGAYVQHFFLEDLAGTGYDIVEYTEQLSKTDTLMPAPGLKAVYAPFTGAAATTLVENLLTALEATQSDYILLGSEEWADVDLENVRLPETNIYYTQSFDVQYGETEVEEFASRFRLRFQAEPNQFAYIGYDVARLVLEVLEQVENPDYLKNGLRRLGNFRGLTGNFGFNGEHVNQKIRIKSIIRERADGDSEE